MRTITTHTTILNNLRAEGRAEGHADGEAFADHYDLETLLDHGTDLDVEANEALHEGPRYRGLTDPEEAAAYREGYLAGFLGACE